MKPLKGGCPRRWPRKNSWPTSLKAWTPSSRSPASISLLAINRASANEFERNYGVRPKVGNNMLDLLADRPEHQANVRAVWGRALAGEEFTHIAEFGEPTGGRRYYEMKFNTLRDREGRRIGAYQFVYDVTERLRDQQRLA